MSTQAMTKAEFFTATHRLTGEVQTGSKLLCDLLNDKTSSYLMVFNIYLSRLSEPGEIGDYAPVAYLPKENINFIIVPRREVRSPEASRYTMQRYQALITLPGFEIRGLFNGPPRFDLRTFSPATLDTFITLSEASAQAVSVPDAVFRGEAILINRVRMESFCLKE